MVESKWWVFGCSLYFHLFSTLENVPNKMAEGRGDFGVLTIHSHWTHEKMEELDGK